MHFGVFCLIPLLLALLSYLISRLYKFYKRTYCALPVWDISKGHHWFMVEDFLDPGERYCNVCEMGMLQGLECDFCGIVCDDGCFKKADADIPCKTLSSTQPIKHHWVEGNLPHYPCQVCSVCEELCGEGPGLCDFRCAWCQATLHKACKPHYTERCDLGKFKRMIIPPSCVRLRQIGFRGRRHWTVQEVVPPNLDNWNPLIVVSNKQSGSGEGEAVMQAFRQVLNPIQIVDLNEVPAEFGLEWCRLLPRCRVLIAGGDGTVGWVLDTAEKLELKVMPQFSILPLGTGNDLSRVFGWGSGPSGKVFASVHLSKLANAVPTPLDRWSVSVEPQRRNLLQFRKRLKMTNYCSVGVDALVTLNFHSSRSRMPRVISGRLMNKFLFFSYGTKDCVERACKDLSNVIRLYLDGKLVENLPDLEGIVMLNIPTWGAGVRPWALGGGPKVDGDPPLRPQSICDGMLEVFGLYSSFHIAQLQVGMSEPYRIGQAKEVQLVIRHSKLPMQVDGEPWLQGPAKITVKHFGQVEMLAAAAETPISENGDGFFYL